LDKLRTCFRRAEVSLQVSLQTHNLHESLANKRHMQGYFHDSNQGEFARASPDAIVILHQSGREEVMKSRAYSPCEALGACHLTRSALQYTASTRATTAHLSCLPVQLTLLTIHSCRDPSTDIARE
jgi:hypothetical protein